MKYSFYCELWKDSIVSKKWYNNISFEELPFMAHRDGYVLTRILSRKIHYQELRVVKKFPQNHLHDFLSGLKTLLSAGITVRESLEISLKISQNQTLKRLIHHIISELDSGKTFHNALASYSYGFDKVTLGLIYGAEKIGSLGSALITLENQLRQRKKIHERTISAIIYPAFVLLSLILCLFFLFVFILPTFIGAFIESGRSSKDLLMLAEKANHAGIIVAIVSIALISLIPLNYIITRRNKRLHYFWDSFILKVPIIGTIVLDNALYIITSSLHSLIAMGMSIEDALQATLESVKNTAIGQDIVLLQERLKKGIDLYSASQDLKSLPIYFRSWLGIGGQTAVLEDVFRQLEAFYLQRAEESLTRALAVIEPMLIIIVGIIIIVVLFNFIIPVFNTITLF